MISLNGRIRALERQGRLRAGCAACGGKGLHILGVGEDTPPWLDASSSCRGCGAGVKLIDRAAWDRL